MNHLHTFRKCLGVTFVIGCLAGLLPASDAHADAKLKSISVDDHHNVIAVKATFVGVGEKVDIKVVAFGTVTEFCKNKGGNIPLGQTEFEKQREKQVITKNGKVTIKQDLFLGPTEIKDAPDCPNDKNWREFAVYKADFVKIVVVSDGESDGLVIGCSPDEYGEFYCDGV